MNCGLCIDGDVRGINLIHLGKDNNKGIIVATNNGFMQLVKINVSKVLDY
jgi:hypothetical protein